MSCNCMFISCNLQNCPESLPNALAPIVMVWSLRTYISAYSSSSFEPVFPLLRYSKSSSTYHNFEKFAWGSIHHIGLHFCPIYWGIWRIHTSVLELRTVSIGHLLLDCEGEKKSIYNDLYSVPPNILPLVIALLSCGVIPPFCRIVTIWTALKTKCIDMWERRPLLVPGVVVDLEL